MALSGLILTTVTSVATLLPVLMTLALGACLVGPVLTSHLSQLAPAGKVIIASLITTLSSGGWSV